MPGTWKRHAWGVGADGSARLRQPDRARVILEAAWEGLVILFTWPNVLYPVVGTLLAMLFAFLPGIGGVTLMALVIPWTFSWSPLATVLLFGALVGGGTFMGSITSILFNVPGTAPNAATMLDGYPMARRGEANTAIACSATASALGSTIGILVLVALIPVMRQVLVAFGPPEFLMLAVWGLATVAMVSRGAMLEGLIAAGLGLLVGFVGMDGRTAELRYTFGLDYLTDGVPVIPVFLGLFGLAEMIDLYVSRRHTISDLNDGPPLSGSRRRGIRAVLRNPGLLLQSSLLGTGIGLVPGVGGTVASFVAYGHAARTVRDGHFGEGDVRGVLAPEAANDAKDGGSLLPVLAFGIPGSEGTVLLLAALTLHGVTPGPELLQNQLSLVFVLIWSLFFSNWLTSVLGLAVAGRVARLTLVPVQLLVPAITLLVMVAALGYRSSLGDLVLTVVFGVVGYAMKVRGWPRVSFVIALVLASLFETSLHLTAQLHDLGRLPPFRRPLFVVLLGLLVVTLAWPLLRRGSAGTSPSTPVTADRGFTWLITLGTAVLTVQTLTLAPASRSAPLWVVFPTLSLLVAKVVRDLRSGPVPPPDAAARTRRGARLALWGALLLALVWLVGPAGAVPLYLAPYLRHEGGLSWPRSLAAAAAGGALFHGLFVRILHMPLPRGVFL